MVRGRPKAAITQFIRGAHIGTRMSRNAPSAGGYPRRQHVDRRAFAYGDAVRHSTRVRFMRRIFPILTGSILVVVALIVWLDPFRLVRDFPLDLMKLSIQGNKLVMDAPKLSGFTKDGRGYNVTAQSAAQDLTRTNVIELNGIIASFTLTGGTTELKAVKGEYDTKADRVQLTEGVVITSSQGYQGRLRDALIEVKKGHVVTTNPVDIIFNNGALRADRMEVFNNGAHAIFEGRVTFITNLPPPSENASPQAEKDDVTPPNTAAATANQNQVTPPLTR